MGALHDGHIALIREARKSTDLVVVSIFVNPTQFGPNEDLDRYPRTIDDDLEICRSEGVDAVFTPSPNEMYPEKPRLRIEIDQMANHLCGASRAGHFSGVLQIVNKLFRIVNPTDAWFGQKDIQQFVLINQMVKEFNIPVTLHRASTIREPDGLALSSRNRYLSARNRSVAPFLHETLQKLHQHILTSAGVIGTEELARHIEALQNDLRNKGFKNDYLSVVRYNDLQPATEFHKNTTYIVAGAVFLGETRLIDNIVFEL